MQDQQSASYNYNEIGDYGTDADFADESVYPTEEAGGGEAGGEGLVALNHQQDDGPYGVVKKYQDDHVCNIQYDVSKCTYNSGQERYINVFPLILQHEVIQALIELI